MAKTAEKKCTECGGAMWNNTIGKKPSKNYPDFKCKDCGHGVWLTKKEKEDIANNPPTSQDKTGGSKLTNYGNSVPPSMYGAWSVNLLISFVGAGKYECIDEALRDLPKVFKAVGDTVNCNVSNNSQPENVSKPPEEGNLPDTSGKPEDDSGLDLGDLENDTFDDLDI